MSLYSQFATNKEDEQTGVWVDMPGDYDEGMIPGFKLARMGGSNKEYKRFFNKALKPHKKAIDLDMLNENVSEKVMMETFVNTVLVAWRNVTDEDENEIPFTKENAIQLFKDLPDLYVILIEESSKAALFKEHAKGEDLKNL